MVRDNHVAKRLSSGSIIKEVYTNGDVHSKKVVDNIIEEFLKNLLISYRKPQVKTRARSKLFKETIKPEKKIDYS
jgi:hypothetical protein